MVSKVVEEAFRNAVMVGKFPFFVLDITLSPENVDVNVHPAKTEIKFANEKKIYDIVYHGVYNAIYGLGKYRAAEADEQETVSTQQDIGKGKAGHTAGSSAGGISVADTGAQRLNPAVVREFIKNTTPLINTENTGASLAKPKEEEELLKALDEHAAAVWQREAPLPMPSSNDEVEVGEAVPTGVMEFVQQADTLQHKEMPKFVLRERDEVEEGIQQSFASDRMDQEKTIVPEEGVRIAGQVFDTYILCESGENMYMIDQHAAHERLRFEELKRAYQKQERMSQLLLSPMAVSYTHLTLPTN